MIEYYQRNAIEMALSDCKKNDLIILSDVDELPDPYIIKNIKSINVKHKWNKKYFTFWWNNIYQDVRFILPKKSIYDYLSYDAIVLRQKLYYYYLNCQSKGVWNGSIIIRYGNLGKYGHLQKLRDARYDLPYVDGGGWHFSYLGGTQAIKIKLKSIVDKSSTIQKIMEELSDDEYIEDCMKYGKDIFGRTGKEFEYEFVTADALGLPNIEKIIMEKPHLWRNY